MPTPFLHGGATTRTVAQDDGQQALNQLEHFMETDDGLGSLKAKPGASPALSSDNASESFRKVEQQAVLSEMTVPPSAPSTAAGSGSLPQLRLAAPTAPTIPSEGSRLHVPDIRGKDEEDSEDDFEIHTVFLGGEGTTTDQSTTPAAAPSSGVGQPLPKSAVKEERALMSARSSQPATIEASILNGDGSGNSYIPGAWVSQVISQDGPATSQSLKYMKALNDPYVKALSAHRRELNASRIDLEREYVDTMASKLSTQRSGALATLNCRPGQLRGNAAGILPSPRMANEKQRICYCYGSPDSPCDNHIPFREESEKVVVFPYHASAGMHFSQAAAQEPPSQPSQVSPLSPHVSLAEQSLRGPEEPGSFGWLYQLGDKLPGLPDVLSVMVGAETQNTSLAHPATHADPAQVALSELIDGMETQL